jgi:hypothetical protein
VNAPFDYAKYRRVFGLQILDDRKFSDCGIDSRQTGMPVMKAEDMGETIC